MQQPRAAPWVSIRKNIAACKAARKTYYCVNLDFFMKERSNEQELIDIGPTQYSLEEYEECLKQLGRIGKFLGGDRATFHAIDRMIQPPQTILDVGCGGGAFTMELAKRYPQARVTGMDISEQAISYANKQLANQPALTNLSFQLADKPTLDYSPHQFDLVTATLVCHHLTDEELITFLRQSVHVAKSAVILNDLHRHPMASAGFAIIAPLLFRNRLIWHDGLLSIKRSFKRSDWMRYLKAADIDPKRVSLTWHWPFRWIFSINTRD